MSFLKSIFTLLVLLSLTRNVLSQQELSLNDIIQKGIENNGDIISKEYDVKVKKREASILNSSLLPTASIDFSVNKANITTRQELIDGTKIFNNNSPTSFLSTGTHLYWTLFNGFSGLQILSRNKNLYQLEKQALSNQIENCVYEILKKYYYLYYQNKVVEHYQNAISIAEKRLIEIGLRHKLNQVSNIELGQTKIYLNSQKLSLLKERKKFDDLTSDIHKLINQSGKIIITDSLPGLELQDIDTIINSFSRNNGRLKVLEYDQKIMKKTLAASKSSMFPKVNLVSNYTFSQTEAPSFFNLDRNRGFTFGASASWNIFNGNKITLIQTNQLIYKKSLDQYNNTLNLLKIGLTQLRNQFVQQDTVFSISKESAELSQQQVENANELFKLGKLNWFELSQLEKEHEMINLEYFNALLDKKLLELDILKQTGKIAW